MDRYATIDPLTRQPFGTDVRINAARVKAGWVGQVYVGNEIVWETKHAYSDQEGALTKANRHVHKQYKRIFGGK